MKIYIDADGSPVVSLATNIAQEYNIEMVIVKNYAHEIHDDYATVITVDIGPDSADYYIANNIKADDIVITQDYGLAALCLAKQARPLSQNGLIFTDFNIEGMLDRRYQHKKLRDQGKHHSKAKKRNSKENEQFEIALRQVIENK